MTQVGFSSAPPHGAQAFAAARAQWGRDGYAIIPAGLPADLCAAMGEAILAEHDRLAAAGQSFKGGGTLSGHLNCFPGEGARKLADAVEAAGVQRFMGEVFGEPVVLASVGCNANLPGSHFQNFHMDSDFTNGFMVINIALVNTDLVNGATELVPGSNASPLRYWRFALKGLWRRGVRTPMAPGDVLIRPSTLWHRGVPNRSRRMRPMIGLVYMPQRLVSKPVDFQEHGGRIVFMANRFASTLGGRITEIIAAHFSWIHASLRFVKSFKAPEGQAT